MILEVAADDWSLAHSDSSTSWVELGEESRAGLEQLKCFQPKNGRHGIDLGTATGGVRVAGGGLGEAPAMVAKEERRGGDGSAKV